MLFLTLDCFETIENYHKFQVIERYMDGAGNLEKSLHETAVLDLLNELSKFS